MGKDRSPDGVSTYPADTNDLDSYRQASEALSQMHVPVLVSASKPHERLFVAAFDGTGNSMYRDAPENHTNVAEVVKQIAKKHPPQINYGYVEGPGTQGGLDGVLDMMRGGSYEARLETMYVQFVTQASDWLKEDPQAQIRIAEIGFSRGAEQAAGFARLVQERGIQNPDGMLVKQDSDGLVESIEFTKPPLLEPGRVPQAVGLFDPVGTGEPRDHDRRLPPSVISGFQLAAEDERRNLFQGTRILDPGTSADGRFLNGTVAGAHSDVGGSYALNGLAIRSGNLMVDYLNALSDTPFLDKRAEPSAPELNVVHRSEEHQFFYRTSVYDREGVRGAQEELAPDTLCRIDCLDAEPRDEAMAAGFEFRKVGIAPIPGAPEAQSQATVQAPAAAADSPAARLDRLLDGRIDPALQERWDREVATQRANLDATQEREQEQAGQQQQQQAAAEQAR
ncbi:T6SS phospholipase effector Tle1-like catalytic domain-containing protein [Marilutibacter maris]|uniref:T6SS Phospholipase effector Tle1-like catalytic domain-containing protein n=1 Tax=Marilutibacter maris TaxID=1605891 RepID=A0A2U9TE29_9GAMM|nr:DUF2235 domain-containing protein [Lysobacter maris]AWV08748.1 hypothetical protein C9I47_3084 [Lysobacter maris]